MNLVEKKKTDNDSKNASGKASETVVLVAGAMTMRPIALSFQI